MSKNDVPLLTGHCALCGYDHSNGPMCNAGKDILIERARVCPVRTEAEVREQARDLFDQDSARLRQLDPWAAHMLGYIAAYAQLKLIAENINGPE